MSLARCVYTYPHPAHRDSIVDCPGVPFTAVAPSADAVQQMLDAATRAFADAGTSSERVEVISDLLASWYAAWPATAVTDEHEGIAHQIVALVDAAEARALAAADRLDAEHGLLRRHLTTLADRMRALSSEALDVTDGRVMYDLAEWIRAIANHRDNAERCPCGPGAPVHLHGVGGYSTSAEQHHVIAFDTDGTWSITHPASCGRAVAGDCRVAQLAHHDVTASFARQLVGGRYECWVYDLGSRFALGDRLHDDQCTPPVCAACGCWCHAEEQTDGEAAQALASELPGWVLDLVRGLVRYEHDHPKLYRYGGAEAWCPCPLLELVPAEVRARAEREG